MNINRKFGLIVGATCMVICADKLVFHHPGFYFFAIPGCILLLFAINKPDALNPVRVCWDKLGAVLGIINTYILLTLLFFIIITPIAFIMRLTKINRLELGQAKDKATYWKAAAIADGSTLKQQF